MPSEFMREFNRENKLPSEVIMCQIDQLFPNADDKISFAAELIGTTCMAVWSDQKINILPVALDRIKQMLAEPTPRLLEEIGPFPVERLLEEAGLGEDAARERAMLKEMMR